MGSAVDVLRFLADLQIVATGDGFDVTLTDSQVASMRKTILDAIDAPSENGTGTRSPVRVTNFRRVLNPVIWRLTWPYALGIATAGIGLGYIIAKTK